jgi:hypothetical protein
MDGYNLRNKQQCEFVLITHYYVPFISIKCRCMLPWITSILPVNHVALVRQSQSIHAPRFLLRTGLSTLCFLYEHLTLSQGTIADGAPIALPTRPVTILWHRFFPTARGSCWFLLTPCCCCNIDFLDMSDTIKIFFWLLWFFRYVCAARTFY